mgnify:CR=1 FL=1
MKNIIILTSSELRHKFVKTVISLDSGINNLRTYCESSDAGTLISTIKNGSNVNSLKSLHLLQRQQTEKDFFQTYTNNISDKSNSVYIDRKEINSDKIINEIIDLNPDLIISYGCSIIKGPLLSKFSGKFINVHLGLSPYYRGSGTNYWPMVNGEFEYIGATFMHIDAGIDTGKIMHQIRPNITWGDSPSQIGNRLITDMAYSFIQIINNFEKLEDLEQLAKSDEDKYYTKKDYSEESVKVLYETFNENLKVFLDNKEQKLAKVPILINPGLN